MPIPEPRLRPTVLEALRRDFGGQWVGLTQAVAWVAIEHGMYPPLNDTRIVQIDPVDEPRVRVIVSDLVAEGILAVGVPGGAQTWPWLSLTAAGRELASRDAQSS